jgi:acetolactate decarboxylase
MMAPSLCKLLGKIVLFLWLLQPVLADRDTVSQFSTIDALLAGVYQGVASFESVLKEGDFGLGTVEDLDGELIILEGVAYQVRDDGSVHRLGAQTQTPFAMVTPFVSEGERRLSSLTKNELERELDRIFEGQYIYAFRLDGTFNLKLRSVPKQVRPFRPLSEVVKEQSVFEFQKVEGTVVAFRCPSFLKGVSVPGYHLHFLSTDRQSGGHVLDIDLVSAKLEWDRCDAFLLKIPSLEQFHTVNLEPDRSDELDRVER